MSPTQQVDKIQQQILEQAAKVRLGRLLLNLIAVPFFVLGWCARNVVALVLVVFRWLVAAVLVGWQTARGDAGGS